MLRDKVSEIMTNRVATTEPSVSVYDAARIMAKQNVGSIVVLDAEKISGILTERDIMVHLFKGADLLKTHVSKLMSRNVIEITADTRIVDAAEIMLKHNFRRLPVVEDGLLVGIVTATDLTFEMNSPHVKGVVSDYMSRRVFSINADAAVDDALEVMVKHKIGAVNALEGGRLVGILTERDVLNYIVAAKLDHKKTKVMDVMTTDVVTVGERTQINHICHLMYYYGYRRFPVAGKNGELIGMVTERDLLKAMNPVSVK